jgi:hypothetical protein
MNRNQLHVFQSQQLTVWNDFLFLPSGSTIHLDASSVGGRLARALLHAYCAMPGLGVEPQALWAAIWPEEAFHDKSRARTKVAVCRLRALGVPVVTQGRRYMLDPRVELRLAAMPRAAA